MTRADARQLGKPPGYALKLDNFVGMTVYLTDYRGSRLMTTDLPGQAEYFERFIDAQEMAKRVTHYTGQPWVVTTVPADNADNAWSTYHLPCPAPQYVTDGTAS